MPFQTFTARLRASTPLNEYTRHLEFEVQDSDRFGFVPGQWVSIRHNKPDGEEITRHTKNDGHEVTAALTEGGPQSRSRVTRSKSDRVPE